MKIRFMHILAAAVVSVALSVTAHAAETHSYSLKSGTYSGAQLVFIDADEDTELYYTTDGSTPDDKDAQADFSPIVVTENTKIRCAAYRDGVLEERSSLTLKIRTDAPEASADSGCYSAGFAVRLTCPDKDADIYYTTDGSVPSKKATLYKGPVPITEDTTLKFIAYKDGCNYSKYCTREYKIGVDPECMELLELVNAHRAAYGLDKLSVMPLLSDIAMKRAEELETCFSHWRPNGTKWDTLLAEYGLKRSVRAENLAGFATAEDAFSFWVNSYYHNVNMLNYQAEYIGIGHYDNGRSNYWILLFLGDE